MKVAFLLGLMLGMSGCFSNTFKMPSWYGKTQIKDDAIIGFGSANTLESAKARALSDIVTQLNVRVDSHFSSSSQRTESKITHYSTQKIQLDSIDIQLNDVQYTKSTFKQGTYYIQAHIPKQSLITQIQTESTKAFNSIHSLNTNQCPTLSIKDQRRLIKALETLHTHNIILQTLGGTITPLQNLEAMLADNTPLPIANLRVQSNITSEIFTNALSKELGHFYKLDSQASQTINIKANIQTNNKDAKVEILLKITDCQNNPIFHANASYTHHHPDINKALKFASQRASVQLYKHIQEWIEQ